MLKFFDNTYIINNKLQLITYSDIINVKFMLFLVASILYVLYFLDLKFPLLCILNIFFIYLLFFLQIVFFTTCERKILALTQRRIGPNIVGDRGRLQYIADALKLVLKVYFSPRKINNLFFQGSSIFIFYIS
jgi:NADH:ubiquinone oxidoreductase subunit H